MIEERNEKKGVAPYLLLLLLTTVLWGIGFVVTEQLTQNNVPVFMLFAIQFAIGAFCLAWFAFFGKKAERFGVFARLAMAQMVVSHHGKAMLC